MNKQKAPNERENHLPFSVIDGLRDYLGLGLDIYMMLSGWWPQ